MSHQSVILHNMDLNLECFFSLTKDAAPMSNDSGSLLILPMLSPLQSGLCHRSPLISHDLKMSEHICNEQFILKHQTIQIKQH